MPVRTNTAAVTAARTQAAPEPVCPLTQTSLTDPVIAPDGRTYERQALVDWLSTHRHLPESNIVANANALYPDRNMRARLDATDAERRADDPSWITDPILLDTMTDPVTASDGRTYEASSLLRWAEEGQYISPFTREPLRPEVYRNRAVGAELSARGVEIPDGPAALRIRVEEATPEQALRQRLDRIAAAMRDEPRSALTRMEENPAEALLAIELSDGLDRHLGLELGSEYYDARRAARRADPRVRDERRRSVLHTMRAFGALGAMGGVFGGPVGIALGAAAGTVGGGLLVTGSRAVRGSYRRFRRYTRRQRYLRRRVQQDRSAT